MVLGRLMAFLQLQIRLHKGVQGGTVASAGSMRYKTNSNVGSDCVRS